MNATASVAGTLVYTPAAGTSPADRHRHSLGHVHPDRHHRLHQGHQDGTDRCYAGRSGDHLEQPGEHPLRNYALRNAAQRDGLGCRLVRLLPGCGYDSGDRHRYALGYLYPDRHHRLHECHQDGQFTVTQAAPVITWNNPASIPFGTTLSATQLNATASVGGTFAYTPAAGTTPATGTDTLSVTFTPTDTTDYTSVTKTVQITVTQAVPVITWNNPANIVYGTTLSATQLNATASVGGSFAYTPAAGTTPATGTDTLSVTFTPTDTTDYTSVTKTVQFTVTQAAPVITWNNPANIVYGTALSATQLNATASVRGTFVYTPAAGTTPPPAPTLFRSPSPRPTPPTTPVSPRRSR